MARKTDGQLFVAKLDERSYKRAMAGLAKWEKRPFRQRVRKAFEAAARLLVAPMKRLAPKRSGGLAGAIAMRHMKKKLDPTSIVAVNVKPRSPKGAHGHLHSQGHKTVNGGWYEGNAFVQRTIEGHESRAVKFMAEQPLDIGGTRAESFMGVLQAFD